MAIIRMGLTGSLASGKGIVADFLKKKGFVYLSLSDELREILKEKKIQLTRENLQYWGNKLRKENGAGVLAEKVAEKINSQKYGKTIIDGIRNPAEIDILEKLDNFILVAVDAPQKTRFKRMLERSRESDPKTFKDFLGIDAKDKGKGEKRDGQQVGKCMKRAKFILINDKNLEEAEKKIFKLYGDIERKIPRLNWDEYFMKMAVLVAERSTCLRHHVGAVVVKDKRMLTTGYNGAAAGVKDCIELGCLRDALGIASGTRHEICRAIHAEQNAIIQAGLHGINISNSTLYCTHTPCMICAKMIVNSGIKEVVSYQDYPDKEARNFLKEAGVKLRRVKRPFGVLDFKD